MLDRALRPPLEEHERAERNRLLPVLPKQVDVDRQAENGQSAEKPWSEKTQLHPPLADRQKIPQTFVERFRGIHENIIETGRARLFRKRRMCSSIFARYSLRA